MVAANMLTAALTLAAEPNPKALDFNRDIRPILSEACYQCHGPDRAKRKANLRLDTSEKNGGLVGLTGVSVITAGLPDDSLLIERILSENPDDKMPPPDSGKSLSASQIQTLRRWVAEGAEFKGSLGLSFAGFLKIARPLQDRRAGGISPFRDRQVCARDTCRKGIETLGRGRPRDLDPPP